MRRLLPLLIPVTVAAQEAKPGEPITSARPDFVETPQIVPVGTVQLELGLTRWGSFNTMRPRTELGEATLRFGLAPRTELRLDLPTYVLSDDPGSRGLNDVRLYAITYLGDVGGISVGLLPAITLPAGTPDVGEGLIEPELYLLLKRETGGGAFVAGTFGTTYARRAGQEASRSRAVIAYRQPVGDRVSLFAEYAGFYAPQERPRNFAHVGIRFTVSQNAAFDIHAGQGLNRGTEQGLLGAGYAVRF